MMIYSLSIKQWTVRRNIVCINKANSHTCEGRHANFEANNLAKFVLCLGTGRHILLIEPHDHVMIPINLSVNQ